MITPALHARKIDDLQEKVNRRRLLIADLVRLEEELLAAGAISRRVVMARSVAHDCQRYHVSLDGRHNMD